MHARVTNETVINTRFMFGLAALVDNPGAGPQGWLRPTCRVGEVAGMDDFYAVDFHTAAARAVAEVARCTDPDGEPVHVALKLALHAWTRCDPPGRAGTDWAMFGMGAWAARDELPTPPLALVVYGDQQPLADTRELRADAARLVTTVASLLNSAAADPHADPNDARAWSQAARRLHTAAADLTA